MGVVGADWLLRFGLCDCLNFCKEAKEDSNNTTNNKMQMSRTRNRKKRRNR